MGREMMISTRPNRGGRRSMALPPAILSHTTALVLVIGRPDGRRWFGYTPSEWATLLL
jgi:hypothetical protein